MNYSLLPGVRRVSRLLVSALALTAVVGAGSILVGTAPTYAEGRDQKDNTAYTIKRIYKTGDADRYKMTAKVKADSPEGPVDMVSTLIMKETTKDAEDDGSCTVIFDIEKMTTTENGMDMDVTSMLPKIIMKRDRDGKTAIKTEGGTEEFAEGADDEIKTFTDFSSAFLPTKAVKIGDTWEVDGAAIGPADPKAKTKSKATLLSVETVKGMKIGTIKATTDTRDEENHSLHGVTLLQVDMATGKTLNCITTAEGEAPEGKLTMEMTMKMLGPGDKGDGKGVFK